MANTPTQQEPLRSVRLPEDEAGHDAPVEWWYFNGHLTDNAGRGYSYHFVTFQTTSSRGLTPRLLQLSWADHARRLHLADERAGFQPAEVTAGRFDVQVSGWQMRGDGVNYGLVFNTGEYSLDLQAISSKPAAPHNQSGLIALGRAGASHYYSRTRLDTSGTLVIGGERRRLNGISWLDRQWGDFRVEQLGWDWVSLQLDDNSELMLYLLRNAADRAPIATYATFVAPDASVRGLDADDITLTATGSWTSPVSGAVYPMGWGLKVASLDLSVGLTPVQDDSEFAISAYVPAAYWEGAVSVMGSKGGSALAGKGFVELVGYDPRPTRGAPTAVPGSGQ